MDSGSIAWLLTASALVLLMTPGLAFFYGGLVRSQNILSTIMLSFMHQVIGKLLIYHCLVLNTLEIKMTI